MIIVVSLFWDFVWAHSFHWLVVSVYMTDN